MLEYKEISFMKRENIHIALYGLFYKEFTMEELGEALGDIEIKHKKLTIKGLDEAATEKKFMRFFRKYKRDLTYGLTGNKAIYVDEDLELPLIGLNFLGIADKGSEILEIKPITGCNANCSFCSVDEGKSSKKQVDFVVDKDYLVAETEELLRFKGEKMSLWINPHGEPTLYHKLSEYCDDMLGNELVKDITIITNGIFMSEMQVDRFKEISDKQGKQIRISLSISGLGKEAQEKSKFNPKGLSASKLMMGEQYNVDTVLRNLEYMAKRIPVTITPVWVCGMNDGEIKKIIELAKKMNIDVSLQKFCFNKRGRNPIKEGEWDEFFSEMKKLEEETGFKLTKKLGKVKETKQLPAVCRKGDRVNVRVVCTGRYNKDQIGAVYGRAISLIGCARDKGNVKATIVQRKNNMLVGKC